MREATYPELIGRVINDLSDLADRQVELAKQEVRDSLGEALGAIKTAAIGAGLGAAAGLLLIIWLWTAFIWFFNLLGDRLIHPWGASLGWILGLVIPAILLMLAVTRFVLPAKDRVMGLIGHPLPRTRETLREDLEWLRQLRTRSTK